MHDLYVVEFGDDDDRSRRAEEGQAAEAARRARYVRYLIETVGVSEVIAELVITALFAHAYPDGHECQCSCHPQPSELHDDGFDCPCSWDDARRAEEHTKFLAHLDDPASAGLRQATEREEQMIAGWVAGQPGLQAVRSTLAAPEQWDGSVDGHSFYFRERHGEWRIELDLAPNGHFAHRVVETDDTGGLVTEPVEMEEGTVIAEGIDTQLGTSPIDHITFIVRTIRDHLFAQQCAHPGALFFCPACGTRMEGLQ